ncbi:outer membrane protein assembly factor BamD [Candidatus Dependentiae bacterium]
MVSKKIKNIEIKNLCMAMICLMALSGCVKQGPDVKKEAPKPKNLKTKRTEKAADTKSHKKTGKAFRDLNYEELKASKNRLLSEGRKDTAIKHIEKMIPLCGDIQELRDLTLEISDLFFETGNLKKAEQLYSQFGQLYPGDKNIEYATYKAILSNYWLTLDKERDQSKTKNTIELAKKFLDRSTIFRAYADEVQQILADCQNKLLESEIAIFKGYIQRGDQLSAKTRLANIEKDFLNEMPQTEPKLLALACEYAEIFDDKTLLVAKKEELNTKFPDYENELNKQVIVAQAEKEKISFVDKF